MPVDERHSIGSTDDLIRSTILDQASDIEHAWREGLQNAIDAPSSTEAHLWYDKNRSIITDDGTGPELDKEKGIKLTTDMGESSKSREDDSSIGQFGVGMGQIFAMGRVTVFSGGVALHFNVKDWGIRDSVVQTPVSDAVEFLKNHNEKWSTHVEESIEKSLDGTTVVISHYDTQMPSKSYKWSNYNKRIVKRFKFLDTYRDFAVYVNDDVISDCDVSNHLGDGKYEIQREVTVDNNRNVTIYMRQSASESIEVYSNGVYVKDMDIDELSGFSGVIVTDSNLSLNFARNEIKSGCQIWNETRSELISIASELVNTISDEDINKQNRHYVAQKLLEGTENYEDWECKKIFKSPSDSYYSLKEINSQRQIGFDENGSRPADRLEEATDRVILSSDDLASRLYKDNMQDIEDPPDVFSPTDVAQEMGLFEGKKVLLEHQLTPRQRNKLGVAREMAERMGANRKINYGKSDLAHAWTDGGTYIVITDSATPSSRWGEWIHELYQTIIHELSHNKPTGESHPPHGNRFNSRYRRKNEKHIQHLSNLINDIKSNGIRSYRI